MLPEEPAEAPKAEDPPRPEQATTPYPVADATGRETEGQAALLVALRLSEDDSASGEAAASVEVGATRDVIAFVRNQSGIVDNYDLSVEGLPADWWSIVPATVYLVPYGAPSGEYQEEVTLTFHPPRAADAEARVWPIRVVATSRANATPAGAPLRRWRSGHITSSKPRCGPKRPRGGTTCASRGSASPSATARPANPIRSSRSPGAPQHRLYRLHQRLRRRGKPGNIAVVAAARELACFLWAAAVTD